MNYSDQPENKNLGSAQYHSEDDDDDEDIEIDSFMMNKKLRVHRVQFDNPSKKLPRDPSQTEIRPPTLSDNSQFMEIQNNSLSLHKVFTSPIIVELRKNQQRDSLSPKKLIPLLPQSTVILNKRESLKKFVSSQSIQQHDKTKQILRIIMRSKFIHSFVANLKHWSYFFQGLSMDSKRLLKEQYTKKRKGSEKEKKQELTDQSPINRAQSMFGIIKKAQVKLIHIPIFDPLSLSMLLWKAFHTIIQLLIFLYVPFLLSFQLDSSELTYQTEIGFFVVLLVDILIQLNQAYMARGQVVRQRKKICKHYIKNHSLKDSLTIVFLFLIFNYEQQPWIIPFVLIYSYLSTKKVKQTVRSVQEYFHLSGILNEAISLIKLVIIILVISHSCACLWHFVGQKSLSYGYNSWILQKGLVDASIFSLYNYAFYWATMTMVTVGYGDVSAQNDLEVCVATCTMFVTCGVFAFAINSIGISLANIQEEKVQAKKTISLINQYMSSNQVEPKLQGRIRNYLEYCLQQEREADDEDIQYIVEKLSTDLRQELFKSIRGKSLKQCQVLNMTFSENALSKMLTCMETIKYSPEETLIQENTFDDFSIYIIQKGNVEVSCNEKVFQKLQRGDCFGERSFFTNQVRSCTVKAIDFVKVYKITQESVLKVLVDADDKEKWCYVRDSMSLYEQYGPARMNCYCCGRQNHLVSNCPVLLYKPDLDRVLNKDSFHDGQERSMIKRRSIKKSSLGMNQQLQDLTKQFILNQESSRKIKEEDDEDEYTVQSSDDQSMTEQISSGQKQGSTSINNIEHSEGLNKFSSGSYQIVGGSVSNSDGVSISKDQMIQPSYLSNYSSQNLILEIDRMEDDQLVVQYPRNDIQKHTVSTAQFNNETFNINNLHQSIQNDRKLSPSIQYRHSQNNDDHTKKRLKVPSKKDDNHYALQPSQSSMNFQESAQDIRSYIQYQPEESELSHHMRLMSQPMVNIIGQKKMDHPKKSHHHEQYKKKSYHNFVGSQRKLPQILEDEQDNFYPDHDQYLDDPLPLRSADRKRQQSIKTITAKNQRSLLRMSSKISTIRPNIRQSTRTGTQMTGTQFFQSNLNINQPTYQSQSGFNQVVDISVFQVTRPQEIDCDSVQTFQCYFPSNNYEQVIKSFNRFQKTRTKIQQSKYTFYYVVKRRAQRIRKILMKRLSKLE